MTETVCSLRPEATIRDAAGAFVHQSIDTIQVLGDNGRPMGVFTRDTLFSAIFAGTDPFVTLGQYLGEHPLAKNTGAAADASPTKGETGQKVGNEAPARRLYRSRVIDVFRNTSEDLALHINLFLDFIHNPVVGIDARGIVVIWNHAAETVFGRSRTEAVGLPITSVVSQSQLQRIVQTGQTELVQKLTVDGKVYMSNRTPVKSGSEVVGAVAVLQDVSKLEAISNELKQTKMISDKLDAVIGSSFDGIVVTDMDGRITMVNRAYERITGVKVEEILGKKMDFLVHEGFYNESVTLLVLEKREPTTIVQRIKTGKTVIVTGTPIFDDTGEIVLVVTNVRDVTELNRLQEELEKMEILQVQYRTRLQKLTQTEKSGSRIIIASKKMEEIQELLIHTARVDTTILLRGESGVGKEVFAELIHANSKRRNNPFVKINCAAIPEQLLESELFGYAPGSFTGARKEGKVGLFEAAAGGTIFLDEIGDIPIGLQSKLLRVIQEKEVLRVGEVSPRKVDVRIIAATNRQLERLIEHRKFRKDLFFRLNVVPVIIPPLRERKESITIFAYHFLEKYNLKYGLSKQLEPSVLSSLIAHDWPGNVRELENVIERLVVTTRGEVITRQKLPENFQSYKGVIDDVITEGKPLNVILEEVEHRVLNQALEHHKTTRRISEVLGISQPTVVRKMRRYGIKTLWNSNSNQGV
ncbi:MAG: sigma 54-interacting transcriptional regulator [Pseudomonadota bacterium]